MKEYVQLLEEFRKECELVSKDKRLSHEDKKKLMDKARALFKKNGFFQDRNPSRPK